MAKNLNYNIGRDNSSTKAVYQEEFHLTIGKSLKCTQRIIKLELGRALDPMN